MGCITQPGRPLVGHTRGTSDSGIRRYNNEYLFLDLWRNVTPSEIREPTTQWCSVVSVRRKFPVTQNCQTSWCGCKCLGLQFLMSPGLQTGQLDTGFFVFLCLEAKLWSSCSFRLLMLTPHSALLMYIHENLTPCLKDRHNILSYMPFSNREPGSCGSYRE